MVSIHAGKASQQYVPTTIVLSHCALCKKQIPRNQFAYATRFWDGNVIRCKPCTGGNRPTSLGAVGIGRRALIGWVHDSAPLKGYVAAQVAGMVEDDSGAAVSLN